MPDVILDKNLTFNDCFRRYYRRLCYFACGYLSAPEKAEDAVQEVFVRLLEGKMTFTDEEHIKRFLYTAVRNACLNQLKLTGIHADILGKLGQDRQGRTEEDFFAGIVRSEIYERILSAVEELPAECGRIFKMAYLDGLDNEEIARQLNVCVNTVKSQKNNAKIRLREKLKDLYPLAVLLLAIS